MRFRKRSGCFTVVIIALGLYWLTGALGVTNASLNPFCETVARYETTAVIEINGKQYTSTVKRLARQSRRWISVMNSAGCTSVKGIAHAFVTDDGHVVLVGSRLCTEAIEDLSFFAATDVAAMCHQRPNIRRPSGYVIDSFEMPTQWQPFWFAHLNLDGAMEYQGVELVSFTASRTTADADDDHATKIPQLFNVRFDRDPEYRGFRPEALLHYSRRTVPRETIRPVIPYGEFLR